MPAARYLGAIAYAVARLAGPAILVAGFHPLINP